MRAAKRREVLRFSMTLLLFCLTAGRSSPAEELLPLRTADFTERHVIVNVDGKQITEETANMKGDPVTNDYGICPYVEVSIAGENDYTDLADSLSGVIPEDCYMYGCNFVKGPYHRMNFGGNNASLALEISGEDAVFPWHLLSKNSVPFYPITKNILVTERQNCFRFDGRYFREQFEFFYRNQVIYITSGMAMRASVYTGGNRDNATELFREWFRAAYNHNYEICYDYGFVDAEERGLSSEKGTFVENLCYFALPKQLTDPGGSRRYQFLGWRVSGEGTDYVPARGEAQAVYKFGIPETASPASDLTPMTLAAASEEPIISLSDIKVQAQAEPDILPAENATGSNLQQSAE